MTHLKVLHSIRVYTRGPDEKTRLRPSLTFGLNHLPLTKRPKDISAYLTLDTPPQLVSQGFRLHSTTHEEKHCVISLALARTNSGTNVKPRFGARYNLVLTRQVNSCLHGGPARSPGGMEEADRAGFVFGLTLRSTLY